MHPSPIRFLHLADIHLGYRQYNLASRERDFFLSFEDAVRRYALPEEPGGDAPVDFVLIAGDLFDSRQIQPITLSRASAVLSMLREEEIPVIAIEGNHDARKRDETPCWYDFLCGEEMMIFLRDEIVDGQIHLSPWDEETRKGGYIDVNEHVRVIGSHWYGASSASMIPRLRDAIASLPPKPFNILMFHGGLSSHVNDLSGGVDYEVFLELRPYVQYLALGHIHQQYSEQNWLFNPGGLEVSKSREFDEPHGAYLATLHPQEMRLEMDHRADYLKRPFVTLAFACEGYTTPEDLTDALRQYALEEGDKQLQTLRKTWPEDIDFPAPMMHLYLTGTLGFPYAKLPLKELENTLLDELALAYLRITNDTQPLEYMPDEDYPRDEHGHLDRQKLEEQVFRSLITHDTRYRDQASPLAGFTRDLKDSLVQEHQLDEQEQTHLVDKLSSLLEPEATPETTHELSTQLSVESVSETLTPPVASSPGTPDEPTPQEPTETSPHLSSELLTD